MWLWAGGLAFPSPVRWDYSCGTAPDFDRLPPKRSLHPGRRSPETLLFDYESDYTARVSGCQLLKIILRSRCDHERNRVLVRVAEADFPRR